jgi:GNAT superfamily N-acetyltransferase
MSVRIRLAVSSEQSALEAVQRRASLNNPGDRDAILAHPDAIELPLEQIAANHVFVAEQDNTIAGFAAVVARDTPEMDLDALFVEPHLWGQGIGRLLIDHCAEVSRLERKTALHVIGNPHAAGFYRACGFEQHGTVATRFGDGLLFRKAL